MDGEVGAVVGAPMFVSCSSNGVNDSSLGSSSSSSTAGDEADVGILKTMDGSDDNSFSSDDEISCGPSARSRVYNALNEATLRGNCCFADRADGTTTTPALPAAVFVSMVKRCHCPSPMLTLR